MIEHTKTTSFSAETRTFGTMTNGDTCHFFTLNSGNGCVVSISEFGAAITSIKLANSKGYFQEICLGFDDLDGQLNDTQNIGVTVGRYANRIANAAFEVNGNTYELDDNIAPHQIHGGRGGLGRQLWQGSLIETLSLIHI